MPSSCIKIARTKSFMSNCALLTTPHITPYYTTPHSLANHSLQLFTHNHISPLRFEIHATKSSTSNCMLQNPLPDQIITFASLISPTHQCPLFMFPIL